MLVSIQCVYQTIVIRLPGSKELHDQYIASKYYNQYCIVVVCLIVLSILLIVQCSA